jgi:AAA+ ATPase superfamily predicted ATPase
MPQPIQLKRTRDLQKLKLITNSSRSEFVYVRGRRRVGKSWLLQHLAEENPANIFYFSGAKDTRIQTCLRQFVLEWSEFSNESSLKEIRSADLHWKKIFDSITVFAKKSKQGITLLLDEIQWIATEGSGFVGKLKEAWITWEKSKKIRVIVCGSSNRFFEQKSGGEEKILRGLRTHADIYVLPIPFNQVRKELLTKWKLDEAAILYMMTGGIPYYLTQIDVRKSFIPAINDAFFTNKSIFLDELDEVLNLDFNKKGLPTTKIILQAIGNMGAMQSTVLKKTKLPDSTVSEVLEKLVLYNIINCLRPLGYPHRKTTKGMRYVINDPFIATYFTLINPIKKEIIHNRQELLFSRYYLKGKSNYYIQNFTGYSFERMIRQILNERDLDLELFRKLDLRSKNFEISQYWDDETQIDLIINDSVDRISRALEIKWVHEPSIAPKDLRLQLAQKNYPIPNGFSRQDFLILGGYKKKQERRPSILITLEDLI